MTVTNTTAGVQGAGQAAGSSAAAIGANGDLTQMFTTLLVAQIKDQDPTQPTDPSQYVTQLANLSQLQSLQTLTSQGGTSNSVLQGLQAMTLGAEVGSQVGVIASGITLGTTPVQGDFTLANANSKVSLVLTDATGSQHSFSLGSRTPGLVSFSLDPASLGLAAGSYQVAVSTDSGETPSVEMLGTLQSVSNTSSNGVMVNVAGLGPIPASQISSYNGWSSGGASSGTSSAGN